MSSLVVIVRMLVRCTCATVALLAEPAPCRVADVVDVRVWVTCIWILKEAASHVVVLQRDTLRDLLCSVGVVGVPVNSSAD